MFKCSGICSECGRCKDAGMIAGANNRKTKILEMPDDFVPLKGGAGYGMAFDIGTTTVVGMLWDMNLMNLDIRQGRILSQLKVELIQGISGGILPEAGDSTWTHAEECSLTADSDI